MVYFCVGSLSMTLAFPSCSPILLVASASDETTNLEPLSNEYTLVLLLTWRICRILLKSIFDFNVFTFC